MGDRILILDNNRDILDVLELALEYEDFEVVTAEQTSDIFDLVNKAKPQLLLIDYSLRESNGAEFCAMLKNDPCTHQLPVIIFSAYFNQTCMPDNFGCDAFIAKPFDIDDLLNKIRQLIVTERSLYP